MFLPYRRCYAPESALIRSNSFESASRSFFRRGTHSTRPSRCRGPLRRRSRFPEDEFVRDRLLSLLATFSTTSTSSSNSAGSCNRIGGDAGPADAGAVWIFGHEFQAERAQKRMLRVSMKRKKFEKCMMPARSVSENSTRRVMVWVLA